MKINSSYSKKLPNGIIIKISLGSTGKPTAVHAYHNYVRCYSLLFDVDDGNFEDRLIKFEKLLLDFDLDLFHYNRTIEKLHKLGYENN